MVEKVSEGIAKSIAEVDVSSNNTDFLDFINKKKKDKKPADMHDMAAVVLGHFPSLLNKSTATGGGTKLTDAHVAANTMQLMNSLLLEEPGDKALRNKILAVAGQQMAEKNAALESKDSLSVNDGKVTQDDKAQAVTGNSVASKALERGKLVASQAGTDSIRSLAARQLESDAGAAQNSSADASLLSRGQAPVMQFDATSTSEPRNEAAARGEKALAQANAMQAASGNATEKQSMDLNYQFQRWSGEHSVKVSIPTEARGESNITLLPSDGRAADALSRHISQLPGQKAELLQPKMSDGSIAMATTDPRAIDNSARLSAQSPEPASEFYHTQHDSEEREQQHQQPAQEEEQE